MRKRYLRDEWTASICILKNTDVKHTPMVLAGSVQKLCPKLGSRCRGPVVEVKCTRKISASIGGGETCQAHCEQSCAAHAWDINWSIDDAMLKWQNFGCWIENFRSAQETTCEDCQGTTGCISLIRDWTLVPSSIIRIASLFPEPQLKPWVSASKNWGQASEHNSGCSAWVWAGKTTNPGLGPQREIRGHWCNG